MNNQIETNNSRWYAVHTHPKQERRAENNLKAWDVETFLPKMKDGRINEITGAQSKVIKPLFPGYLFARFVFEQLFSKVRFTRGVHSVVSLGEQPAPVDDRVIEIITSQVDREGFVDIGEALKPGTQVLVQAGPFRGLTGIFEQQASAARRIKILLDSVYYQAHLEIDKLLVRPVTD
jgi:transcriptional antiterminator RfaH